MREKQQQQTTTITTYLALLRFCCLFSAWKIASLRQGRSDSARERRINIALSASTHNILSLELCCCGMGVTVMVNQPAPRQIPCTFDLAGTWFWSLVCGSCVTGSVQAGSHGVVQEGHCRGVPPEVTLVISSSLCRFRLIYCVTLC